MVGSPLPLEKQFCEEAKRRHKCYLFKLVSMDFWFPVVERREGAALILVPELKNVDKSLKDQDRIKAAVFYNPIMQLNRDTAVLILSILGDELMRPTQVCEPMCGSGVRGVRFALEAGAGSVALSDLNPSGVELTEENIRRNGVGNIVRTRVMDANLLLNLHSSPNYRFDYVDIDPFGTPSPFLDSALRATRDGGILALTATDMAPLCGVNPAACLRKYGGKPIRCTYSHEVALRLLVGSAVRASAIHELAAVPVFSYYADHYVRAYLRINYSAKSADTAIANMGYLVHCEKCLYRETMKGPYLKMGRSCPECGTGMKVAGPMWLGELANPIICAKMLEKVEKTSTNWERRLESIIRSVRAEIGYPPTFIQIDEISSHLHIGSQNLKALLIKLETVGYKATITHFSPRGVKTNATVSQLANVLKD